MSTSAAATLLTFTVPINQSESDAQDLGGAAPLRLYTPAALTSGTVNLGFKVSYDGANFRQLLDDAGSAVVVTVDPAAAQAIAIPIDPHGVGYGWLKLVLMESTPAAKSQSSGAVSLLLEVR